MGNAGGGGDGLDRVHRDRRGGVDRRLMVIAAGNPGERVWQRDLPAWVISGVIHLTLMAGFLVYQWLVPGVQAVAPESTLVETRLDDPKPEQQNFENTDVGLDPTKETNYNNDRIETIS